MYLVLVICSSIDPVFCTENISLGKVKKFQTRVSWFDLYIQYYFGSAVAMARGRRKQIIQSHEEYLSEEHIGQESHGQNTEASELHSSARGDQIDGDGDIEVNFHGTY